MEWGWTGWARGLGLDVQVRGSDWVWKPEGDWDWLSKEMGSENQCVEAKR